MIDGRSSTRMADSERATGIRQGRARRRGGRSRSKGDASAQTATGMLESVLKENASALTFLGITLGVFVSRKFFAIPVAVAAMLAQESLGLEGLARARRAVRG